VCVVCVCCCVRFQGPPWQEVELESKELMVMCLRKINGLNKMKIVDAAWIWTEPHSLRLKIKLTVQKEISQGAFLQQATVCEFVIRNQQCKHCEASFATGAWHAIVQVRQRVAHKRTFFYLEQLMLKHEAHKECVKIVVSITTTHCRPLPRHSVVPHFKCLCCCC
jgi:nonsense-mediated mRNA decay protein 3